MKLLTKFLSGAFQTILPVVMLAMILNVPAKGQQWEKIYKEMSEDYSTGRYSEGLAKSEEALKIAETESGKQSENYGHTLIFAGHFNNLTYNYDKAAAYYRQATRVYSSLSPRSANVATATLNLANVLKTQGNYLGAEPLYLEATAIIRQVTGESTDYTTYAYYLALCYEEMFRFESAEKIHIRNIEITRQLSGEKSETTANMLFALGSLYEKWLKYEEAEAAYKKAMNIYFSISGEQHPFYASMLNYLGHIYHLDNNLFAAEEYYNKALETCRRTLGEEHEYYAAYLNNFGNLCERTGRRDEALKCYNQVASIYKKVFGTNHSHYATALNNLAIIYTEKDELQKALDLLKEVENIYKTIYGENHAYYAIALFNIGDLLQKAGQIENALPYFQKAAEINKKVFGEKHPSYAKSLIGIGSALLDAGQYPQAEKSLTAALDIYIKVSGENHYDVAEVLSLLGKLSALNGDLKNGDKYFTRLQKNITYQVVNYFPALSEKEKGVFISGIETYINQINAFYIQNPFLHQEAGGKILNNQMLLKGILLNTSIALRHNIYGGSDKELELLYNKWMNVKNLIGKSCYLTTEQTGAQGINLPALMAEANALEKKLTAKSDRVAEFLNNIPDWKNVQKKLRQGEAAIEIIRTADLNSGIKKDSVLYTAIIIRNSGNPQLVVMNDGRNMESRYIQYYRNNIALRRENTLSYGHFWLPVSNNLAGINRIYLSADGVYNKLTIATLFNPATSRFLLQDLDIVNLSATRDLLSGRKHELTEGGRACLFGNPDYNDRDVETMLSPQNNTRVAEDVSRGVEEMFAQTELTELEGTKKEIEEIEKILKTQNIATEVYLRKKANEGVLKSIVSPAILHIATHGFFIEKKDREKKQGDLHSDPLFRSGLILAGVRKKTASDPMHNRSEDGILTAYEAMNLNLTGTCLVGLSACETGLGDVQNGEGVYGLKRAFQIAGARFVLMSLWKVDDTATQELMVSFYRNWMETKNIHQSFRKAQEETFRKYPDPYYWGAFQLTGH